MKKNSAKFYIALLLNIMGIMVHEFSHYIFCVISGVKVYKVVFFQFKNPIGYVEHGEPKSLMQSFFITFGPFFIGTIVSSLLFIHIFITPGLSWLDIFAIWFGASIASHSFPSPGDARALLAQANKGVFVKHNPFAILLYPFVLFIKLINFLRHFYLDYIYSGILIVFAWYMITLIKPLI